MSILINREKFKTETGRKLYDMLKDIWDDEHWMIAVAMNVKGDDKKQKLIEIMENNFSDFEFEDDITETSDKIILLSMEIADGLI